MAEKDNIIPDIRIRDVDKETHKIVLNEQKRQKEMKGCNRLSLSDTIKYIVNDWHETKSRRNRYNGIAT